MNSEEIRDRIAKLEAEAAEQFRSDKKRDHDQEPWPWQFLFEGARSDPSSARDRGFSWDQWWAEGLRGLRESLHHAGLNDEFWDHLRAAEREFLLAWRCLIDARLQRWEERQRESPPDPARRQDIDIEFE